MKFVILLFTLILGFTVQSCGGGGTPAIQDLTQKNLPEVPLTEDLAKLFTREYSIPSSLHSAITRIYLRTLPYQPICDLEFYERKDLLRFDSDLNHRLSPSEWVDAPEGTASFKKYDSSTTKITLEFNGTNEDRDGDFIPSTGSFNIQTIFNGEYRKSNLKISASFHDENDRDWKTGYQKEVNFSESSSGHNASTAGCTGLLIKTEALQCQQNFKEKSEVKIDQGIYFINHQREILVNAENNTAQAQYSSKIEISPELLKVKDYCSDNKYKERESLARKGLIKKFEGNLDFDFENRRYKTKFNATPLRYDAITYNLSEIRSKIAQLNEYQIDPGQLNPMQVLFDDGMIEYEDSFGNKIAVIYKRTAKPQPTECPGERNRNPDQETEFSLSLEVKFNDRTVDSKSLTVCLRASDNFDPNTK